MWLSSRVKKAEGAGNQPNAFSATFNGSFKTYHSFQARPGS